MQETTKNNYRSIVSFTLYGLIFLLFTFPLISHFSSRYIGIPLSGDSSSYVWSIWHFRYSIMHGFNPFETKMLFYPLGSSLIMHGFIPSVGILNLFIDNPILTLNITLLLNFAFSGLGVFKLLGHFKIQPFLCFMGGFIYAFFPYKTSHLSEHFNLELTALIPFIILFVIKAFRFEQGRFFPSVISKKYLIYLILISILSVFTDYYYSIYAFYFGMLFALINKLAPFFEKFSRKKNILITLILFVAGHFLIRGFVLLDMDDKGALWWSADVASLFVPGGNSFLYGNLDWVKNYPSHYFRYPESVEFVMFIGYGFICMIVLFLIRLKDLKNETTLKMMGVASLFFLLFCFPEFKFLSKRLFYNVTGLLYYIPFLNNVRTPSRYQLMFMVLFLPILMKVMTLLWEKKTYRILITILSIFLFFEYIPGQYTTLSGDNAPLVYKKLKDLPDGAILPVPFGFRDGIEQRGNFNTNHFLYQTIHHKPIIGGYISRLSKENLEQFSGNPTARDLFQIMDNKYTGVPVAGSFSMPVRYVVVEPGYASTCAPYLDIVLKDRIVKKTQIENYLMYELRR